jgi:ABC-type lipopolysaccharide export system ATPase subunit
MSELIVENLRKSFKSRTVVQDISLRLKSGEVVGLLGPCWQNFTRRQRLKSLTHSHAGKNGAILSTTRAVYLS